jgi:hypothetical protein
MASMARKAQGLALTMAATLLLTSTTFAQTDRAQTPARSGNIYDHVDQSKGLAQDLKDCEAPTLQAPTAASVPGAPTIERSESSHVVAECMAEKGYRKIYTPLGATFP